MRIHLSEEDERLICDKYNNGIPGSWLSAEYGVDPSRIYKVLDKHSIPRNKTAYNASRRKPNLNKRLFSVEQELEITDKYTQGTSASVLSKDFNCNLKTILEIVRRNGGVVRERGAELTNPTEEQIATIISLFDAGKSRTYIAGAMNSSVSVISRILINLGYNLDTKRLMGKDSKVWKGGRIVTDGGYVSVIMSIDHPFAQEMRTRAGYCLEHRLVMAEHLNRPLERHETVHHINGDKQDNRIENLQLRSGNHGKGVRYICVDCGSHNVKEIEF